MPYILYVRTERYLYFFVQLLFLKRKILRDGECVKKIYTRWYKSFHFRKGFFFSYFALRADTCILLSFRKQIHKHTQWHSNTHTHTYTTVRSPLHFYVFNWVTTINESWSEKLIKKNTIILMLNLCNESQHCEKNHNTYVFNLNQKNMQIGKALNGGSLVAKQNMNAARMIYLESIEQ